VIHSDIKHTFHAQYLLDESKGDNRNTLYRVVT